MQTLDILKKRIKTTGDLLGVVKTMKSLAAVNIRHFEQAARSLTEYADVIEQAWGVLFRTGDAFLRPGRETRAVVLAIGSDQGMCGQFNELAIRTALTLGEEIKKAGLEPTYWTVGDRVRAGIRDAGKDVPVHMQIPGTLGGIDVVVNDLVNHMASWYQRIPGQFHVVHNTQIDKEGYSSHSSRVIPLDREWEETLTESPWPNRCLPQVFLPTDVMFATLFEQHLFVSLYGALARSMAAENAARLATMQAAEKNIEEMRDQLQNDFLQTRQNAITGELLDIVSGVEAITTSR